MKNEYQLKALIANEKEYIHELHVLNEIHRGFYLRDLDTANDRLDQWQYQLRELQEKQTTRNRPGMAPAGKEGKL